ncbi:MAG: preprotein translocase subunit SecA [Mycoplasmataceae bacterium]|nr:preprotein translocase subunit SecA [Mycoplasmataceae bacterium]
MKLFFKKHENKQPNSLSNKKEIKEEKAIQKRQNKRKKRSIKELAFKSAEFREAEFLLKKINYLGRSIKNLTDEQLRNKTRFFKQRLSRGETLDDIRIEAFAVAREAVFRVLGKRPFDVQILGGLILDMGSVAEMKTGEGKTITSIAPIYLNALDEKGVIVSTVNEYLAERDSQEMGEVFKWLGLTVGLNKVDMSPQLKKQAYACDITYSVHSELGFDYLRDNTVRSIEEKVQRGLNYALIDEVDSILIDEAKTPLIISGGEENESSLYTNADLFVKSLTPSDYFIDQETQGISLSFNGVEKANKWYKTDNLYKIENTEIVHRIQNALRANLVMKKDFEYVVMNDKIELVDQFTGRIMEGRSYSEGLQQAIQAKENVKIEPETKTIATITYQNFFRMFKKLSGMTGTGKTEESEFINTYNMRVNVIPTNKPILRIDHEDQIYLTMNAKYKALVEEIKRIHKKGQPILVGTTQVEESEYLHQLLVKEGLQHTVLNAKQNLAEAEIIKKAGVLNAITIATNMAGRGTDIKLGEGVKEVGGLFVLGTDKSESRRIDNQLKGRAGRQGDVGESKFFLSIEDRLIQRFSLQDKWKEIFKEFKDNKITGGQIVKAFERAQRKIEGFNYDSRKSVLNYDDVVRKQRELLYKQRDLVLKLRYLSNIVKRMISNVSKQILFLSNVIQENGSISYDNLVNYFNENFLKKDAQNLQLKKEDIIHFPVDALPNFFKEKLNNIFDQQEKIINEKGSTQAFQSFLRSIILNKLDFYWQEHINVMDKLRSSVHVVQYSQKNPYQIYTEEGSNKFNEMVDIIAWNTISAIFTEIFTFTRESKSQSDIVNPDLLQNIITDKFNEMNQKDFVEFLEGKQSLDLKFEYQDPIQAELIELDLAIRNIK